MHMNAHEQITFIFNITLNVHTKWRTSQLSILAKPKVLRLSTLYSDHELCVVSVRIVIAHLGQRPTLEIYIYIYGQSKWKKETQSWLGHRKQDINLVGGCDCAQCVFKPQTVTISRNTNNTFSHSYIVYMCIWTLYFDRNPDRNRQTVNHLRRRELNSYQKGIYTHICFKYVFRKRVCLLFGVKNVVGAMAYHQFNPNIYIKTQARTHLLAAKL